MLLKYIKHILFKKNQQFQILGQNKIIILEKIQKKHTNTRWCIDIDPIQYYREVIHSWVIDMGLRKRILWK